MGAGSFGTAVAILLVRAGLRTTLLCRTADQAQRLTSAGENEHYLPGVPLPEELKVRVLGGREEQFHRADLVFLAVPSAGLAEAIAELARQGVARRAGVISLAKGLVPPEGVPPTVALEEAFGRERVGCVGGPAHAREMVDFGAGLVAAANDPRLAERVAAVFIRSGLVCEASSDPVGVELAGCAKNAAALAAGATEAQGLNAAGMAAADIFTEVVAVAARGGGDPTTFIGRAGTGDLVATALARTSRNRSAGELLARGVPAADIPAHLGQASEALETVRLLARRAEMSGVSAPVLTALAHLIDGDLPLDEWVALVRARQPQLEQPHSPLRGWLERLRERLRTMFRRAPGRAGETRRGRSAARGSPYPGKVAE